MTTTISTKSPLLDDAPEDTMNNVADVLEFLNASILALGEHRLKPTVASGMIHVLNCCTHALKGGRQ